VSSGIFENLQRKLEDQDQTTGLTMSEILTMPTPLRRLVNWMLRQQKVSFADVIAFVGEDEATGREMLVSLMEKGIVRQIEHNAQTLYYVRMAARRGRTIPLNVWKALEEKIQEEQENP
jgi:hypothetical protein